MQLKEWGCTDIGEGFITREIDGILREKRREERGRRIDAET